LVTSRTYLWSAHTSRAMEVWIGQLVLGPRRPKYHPFISLVVLQHFCLRQGMLDTNTFSGTMTCDHLRRIIPPLLLLAMLCFTLRYCDSLPLSALSLQLATHSARCATHVRRRDDRGDDLGRHSPRPTANEAPMPKPRPGRASSPLTCPSGDLGDRGPAVELQSMVLTRSAARGCHGAPT